MYKICVQCHGTDGKNIALGRSPVIAGWEPQKTKDGLKSFVDGTSVHLHTQAVLLKVLTLS